MPNRYRDRRRPCDSASATVRPPPLVHIVLAVAVGFVAAPAGALGQGATADLWPIRLVHVAERAVIPPATADGLRVEVGAPGLWTESPQVAPPPHHRTGTGFAAGAALSAVVASTVFNGNFCTGSGDYLGLCRAFYVGTVAAGAGLGALAGRVATHSDPPGRSLAILRGAAVGALGMFALSLPFCGNEYERDNPSVLCSREGMPTALHTGLAGAGGALIANFLSRGSAGTGLGFGVAPGLDGSATLMGRVACR
jgi:hypothetical protein